jgi:hypothetical protein
VEEKLKEKMSSKKKFNAKNADFVDWLLAIDAS